MRDASQRRSIGDVLLDQSVVAGIGNLWRSELLYDAGIDPQRRLNELDDGELRSLLRDPARRMSSG